MKLSLVGFDPSLRNWGVSVAEYDTESQLLVLKRVDVILTTTSKDKQVRKNCQDIDAAQVLHTQAYATALGANAVFVETPVGSQNSRAAVSYGVCVGLLGALRSQGIPFFQVSADEVKIAGAGYAQAKKQEMIDWAVRKHPEAAWPTTTLKGIKTITASKAEHMADATAAIYAGLRSPPFQQLLAMWGKHTQKGNHDANSTEAA